MVDDHTCMGRDSKFQKPAHSHLLGFIIFSTGLALSIPLRTSSPPDRREIRAQACDITVLHCIVDSRESRAGITFLHSSYTKKLSDKNVHHIVVEHPSGISEYLDKNKKAKAQFRRRGLTGDFLSSPVSSNLVRLESEWHFIFFAGNKLPFFVHAEFKCVGFLWGLSYTSFSHRQSSCVRNYSTSNHPYSRPTPSHLHVVQYQA